MKRALIGVAAFAWTLQADLNKPLALNEYWGVPRTQEWVTGGIPLPKAMITDVRQLGVFDDQDVQRPLQTRALMKWPDGSLRWLLITFPADAAAQSTTQYHLKLSQTPSFTSPAYAQGQVAVTETAGDITVSTGKLIFVIRKTGTGFNLFDRVLIAKDADGLVDDEMVSPSLQNGAILWDKTGNPYTSGNDFAYQVKVEEAGPLCTVIKVTGNHSNGSTDPRFYGYLCRIYAYAGKSYVNVQYSVKNAYYTPRGPLEFSAMHLELKSNLSGSQQVTLFADSLYSGALADSAYVYQGTQSSCGAVNGAATVRSGSRALGWIDVSDNTAGVAAGSYEFASNCPQELHVQKDGKIEARLWPRRYTIGSDAANYQGIVPETDRYFVGIAEHKTHTLRLYFHKGTAQSAGVEAVMGAFNHPLRPEMDKQWISLSRAVPGEIAEDGKAMPDPSALHLPLINKPLSDPSYVGPGGTSVTRGYYDSWCTFGEAKWRNETGDAEIMENQGCRYLRSLSPATFRLFQSNAWLYADFRGSHVDSVVGYDPVNFHQWWTGAAGKKDPVHSNGLPDLHQWIAPTLGTHTEHYTNRDLFLYYLVSGDLKIRDAVYEFADMSNYVRSWRVWGATAPGLGGMVRAQASSWASLMMAGFIENPDSVKNTTYQNYFLNMVKTWTHGAGGKVGIISTLRADGAWDVTTQGTITGPHVFMESLVDMPFNWHMDYFWHDSLKPYLDRRVKAWRDSILSPQGSVAYHGWYPAAPATPQQVSVSNWRLPGPLALLYAHSGDSGLIAKTNLLTINGTNPQLFGTFIDHTYFDKYDGTFSQAYLLYNQNRGLFLQNPIITWSFDPTAVESALPAAMPSQSPLRLFPNPGRGRTAIVLGGGNGAQGAGFFKVRIFDVRGREVMASKSVPAPSTTLWDTSRLPSGVYWVSVQAGGKRYHQKAVVTR